MRQCFMLLLLAVLSISACKTGAKKAQTTKTPVKPAKKPMQVKTQAEIDEDKIQAFLKKTKWKNVKSTESGLHYVITEAGSGGHPAPNAHVTAHYKGMLLNGQVFDSSYDRGQPLDFNLKQVILGWQEGLKLMKKGGKAKLLIPSELAYGKQAMGNKIPANSVLYFEVELLGFHVHDGKTKHH